MAKHNDHETPYYIRTASGDTFQVDTLEEALAEFNGPDGYRLTLKTGSDELVIRLVSDWTQHPSMPWEDTASASVTRRQEVAIAEQRANLRLVDDRDEFDRYYSKDS